MNLKLGDTILYGNIQEVYVFLEFISFKKDLSEKIVSKQQLENFKRSIWGKDRRAEAFIFKILDYGGTYLVKGEIISSDKESSLIKDSKKISKKDFYNLKKFRKLFE